MKIITISEEKKEKIIELFQNGVNKKDITKVVDVSYPSIRNILRESGIEGVQDEQKERTKVVEKKLSDIFKYEDYTEEGVLELIYNLIRVGKICGRDLGEFISDIELIFDQYCKISDNPIKLFDFLMDISREMNFVRDSFDMGKLLELIGSFMEQHIFLEQLREEYNSIEEFKERKEELERERKETNARFDDLIRISKNMKETNQKLSDIIIRTGNTITNQKAYYKKKLGKLIRPKKIKKLKLEIYTLNQVIMDFDQRFPKEVKQYIEEIKIEQTS